MTTIQIQGAHKIKSVSVHIDRSQSSSDKKFYTILHDWDIWNTKAAVPNHGQYYDEKEPWYWRNNMPEVYWLFDGSSNLVREAPPAEITRDSQMLYVAANPNTTMKMLRVALDYDRAFTNRLGMGFDTKHKPDDILYVPLYDYFNQRDLNSRYPRHDKIRLCGGATVKGWDDGEWVYPEYIEPYDIPTWSDLKPKWWLYFNAINIHKAADGSPTFSDFNQGNGYPLVIPFISLVQPKIPFNTVKVVTGRSNPYEVYTM